MNRFKLNKDIELAIEPYKNKARLVVYRAGAEWVCRKEQWQALKQFMEAEQAHLFKGRLQLNKSNEEIHIFVKGENEGMISLEDFRAAVEQMSTTKHHH